MVSVATFRQWALSFTGAGELPHFDKTSFRIKGKIFATVNEKENRCCLKLPLIEQSVFCSYDPEIVYPVPNKWGKQGWTLFSLKKVRKDMLKDALTIAFEEVSTKKK